MMGFGSFGQGGSSSSSTLSPLAQPFTVNRSAIKPKPSPPPHVFENFYDYDYLDSHTPNPIPVSDSFPQLNSDIGSVGGFGYFGNQLTVSCGTHLPSLSPTTHGFSYGQHSESVVASNVIEAEPYYPHYSSIIHDNNSSGLKESDYGILNLGTSAPLDGSSQTGYMHNLSDFWFYGLGKDVDASSSWKEPKGNVGSHYRSSLLLGAPATEGFMTCEEASGAWHGKVVESPARKVYIGSTGTGVERIDAKHSAISEANANVPYFNITGKSGLVPSTIQETTYSHKPDPSFTKAWNPFNLNTASYDRCFTPIDSCTTDPTIFYPSVTTQPILPASGSSSSLSKVMLKDMKFHSRPIDVFNNKDTIGQVSVKVQAPTITLNADTSKINDDMGKDDHISLESSQTKIGLPLNQKSISDNSLNDFSMEGFELKLTHLRLPKASNCSHTDRLGDSLQNSSDALDQLISAVDSPCWKGVSSRHSPFTVVDAEAKMSLAKEPEGCNDLSQHNQILPVNANDAEAVSSPKPCESLNNQESLDNSLFPRKLPLIDCSLSAEHKLNDAEKKSGADCFEADSKNGAQCSDGFPNLGNGYMLYNSPKSSSGLKTFDVISLSQEEVVTSAQKHMLQNRVKEPGMHFNAAQDGSSDFRSHDKEQVSSPSSSEVRVPNEVAKIFRASDMSSQRSIPRLDTPMLVKTIHNLSELLTSSDCSDANALNENECEVILLVINNLVGLLKQFSKSVPEFGSYCIRKSTDPNKGTTAGRPLAIEVESDAVPTPGSDQSTLCGDGVMHSHLHRSGKKVDKLGVFARNGDMDFDKDMEMIKDLKKVIKQNICEQGEHHHQTLLFKDLWIEAEAKLCSIKYELQLARMEIEMEKSKQHQTEGTDFQTSSFAAGKNPGLSSRGGICGEKTPASNANKGPAEGTTNKSSYRNALEMNLSCNNEKAEDVQISSFAAGKTTDGKNLGLRSRGGICGEETPASNANKGPTESTTNKSSYRNALVMNQSCNNERAEDVEAPVMARFSVLKSRDADLSSMSNNKLVQQKLPDSIFIGGNVLNDMVFSPGWSEGKFEVGMKENQMDTADLGPAGFKKPWPSIQNQWGVVKFRDRSDIQHLHVNHTDEIGLGLDVSERHSMDKGSHQCVVDESATQSYTAGRLGNQVPVSSYDSTPSDWENLLE